jgi:hypothetical protein
MLITEVMRFSAGHLALASQTLVFWLKELIMLLIRNIKEILVPGLVVFS